LKFQGLFVLFLVLWGSQGGCEHRRETGTGEWVPLKVLGVSPSASPRAGGTPSQVWIASSRYDGNPGVEVEIGGILVVPSSILGPFSGALWALSVVTPSLPPGAHPVRVRRPNGETHTLEKAYAAVPSSLALSPVSTGFGLTRPGLLCRGDFDGDGRTDLGVAHGGTPWPVQATLLTRQGPCTFAFWRDIDAGDRILLMASADLNGDEKGDLVLACGDPLQPSRVRIALSTTEGPVFSGEFTAGANPVSLRLSDLDDNGAPDLLFASGADLTLETHLNAGEGRLVFGNVTALPGPPGGAAVGRFDADNMADVVLSEPAANRFLLLSGDGAGGFFSPAPAGPALAPALVEADDLTGDGFPDLVASLSGSSALRIAVNDGSGAFLPAGSRLVAADPSFLRLVDFDLDGTVDIVAVCGSELAVFCGDGAGGFLPGRELQVPFSTSPGGLALFDGTGNGLPDIYITEPDRGLLWVCVNTSF
jgi:hypothetical protein